MVYVSIQPGAQRPVRITCRGHVHHYELAWRDTDDGPVITDLRVKSDDGAPITSDSLRRINTVRLAHAAQLYDTPQAAERGRRLRKTVDDATADLRNDPAAMIAETCAELASVDDPAAAAFARQLRALDPAQAAAWVATAGEGLQTMRLTEANLRDWAAKAGLSRGGKRRGGRPPLTREFLAQVADWAREAARMETPYYSYIAEQVNEHYDWEPRPETIKVWIKRCKDPNDLLGGDALGRDELRRPRTPRTSSREDG